MHFSDLPRERLSEKEALLKELEAVKSRLYRAYLCFNTAASRESVEASIYEINALQARYGHVIKSLKSLNVVSVDAFRFPESGGNRNGGGPT